MSDMKKRRASSRDLGRGPSLPPSASPVAGRGVKSALHSCQTSSLPIADKPYSNKEEGQNKAEKELAADHGFISVVCEV